MKICKLVLPHKKSQLLIIIAIIWLISVYMYVTKFHEKTNLYIIQEMSFNIFCYSAALVPIYLCFLTSIHYYYFNSSVILNFKTRKSFLNKVYLAFLKVALIYMLFYMIITIIISNLLAGEVREFDSFVMINFLKIYSIHVLFLFFLGCIYLLLIDLIHSISISFVITLSFPFISQIFNFYFGITALINQLIMLSTYQSIDVIELFLFLSKLVGFTCIVIYLSFSILEKKDFMTIKD
ncbi:hypothetical protein CBF31_01790 [Vagococcus fessus]|uniref:Uncharacterized protein n=1 Tax=Vagococcus fessus TaxID=120370 RepID=A0A430AC34_9ENTE|nr:hypothetical protein CBF31_01790 [Vagococcus fessus]